MIDINMMRDPAIQLNGLHDADKSYTFYYDETNNIRKLHIKPDGLNVNQPKCFVLGGIVHQGASRSFDIDGLRSTLNIQKNAKEIKLKHLGSGAFLDLLQSHKIATFLDWLDGENLFVHFQVLDVMYWSVVDIVDSILTELAHPQLLMSGPILKNDLYSVLRLDLDKTVSLLQAYEYPNVGRDRRHRFVDELVALIDANRGCLHQKNYQMLKGVLQMSKGIDSLPYLEEEEPLVLIKEFSAFYINRICLFKHATHILDVEDVIQSRLSELQFTDEGQPVENYQFVDSTDHDGIQIADVLIGLLGKAFTYLNQTDTEDIALELPKMTEIQHRNLSSLSRLVDRSISENAAFAQYIISGIDQQRAQMLFEQ